LALLVILAIVMGASVVTSSQLLALILPGMVGVLVLVAMVLRLTDFFDDEDALRRVMWWTMVSFGAHLLVGLLITNIGPLRGYLGPDSLGYHAGAVDIVQHWRLDYPLPDLPSGKEGFFYALAGLYWLVGTEPTAGLVMNATLAAAMVPLMADLTNRLAGPRAAHKIPPLLVLLPGLMLWPSQLLREAGMLFLLVLVANLGVRLSERVTVPSLLGLVVSIAVMLTFRGYIAVVVAGTVLCGVALSKRHLLAGVGTAISAVLIGSILVLSFGLGYAGYQTAVNANLQQANIVRQGLSVSVASGYASDVDVSNSGAAITYLPRGLTSFMLGPFPWQIRGVRQLPALPDVIVWWYLLPMLWRGCQVARREGERRAYVLLLPALGVASVLGLILANYGILVRERTQVVVLLLPLIAWGLADRAREREQPGYLAEQAAT